MYTNLAWLKRWILAGFEGIWLEQDGFSVQAHGTAGASMDWLGWAELGWAGLSLAELGWAWLDVLVPPEIPQSAYNYTTPAVLFFSTIFHTFQRVLVFNFHVFSRILALYCPTLGANVAVEPSYYFKLLVKLPQHKFVVGWSTAPSTTKTLEIFSVCFIDGNNTCEHVSTCITLNNI